MSYLLDTCVISLLRNSVAPEVRQWFEEKDENLFFLSVVSIAEIEDGIARLRSSQKKKDLQDWLYGNLMPRFESRILSIDIKTAKTWGHLNAHLLTKGKQSNVQDLYIAATAQVYGFAIVTTNTKDFIPTGLVVLNPWKPIN